MKTLMILATVTLISALSYAEASTYTCYDPTSQAGDDFVLSVFEDQKIRIFYYPRVVAEALPSSLNSIGSVSYHQFRVLENQDERRLVPDSALLDSTKKFIQLTIKGKKIKFTCWSGD